MDSEDNRPDPLRSGIRRERSKLNHSVSDPMPIMKPMQNSHESEHHKSSMTLPQVLVITGLERTSTLIQKTLLNVLTTRQVILNGKEVGEQGVWNLPDGFVVVCVSPTVDVHERVSLHKSIVCHVATSSSLFQGWLTSLLASDRSNIHELERLIKVRNK